MSKTDQAYLARQAGVQLEQEVATFLAHWEDSPALPSEAAPLLVALVKGVKRLDEVLGDLKKITINPD